jgi:hypothetical protein
LASPDVEVEIANRISILEKSQSKANRGLSDDLFWPSSQGRSLKLRPGFAFISFDYLERGITQADLYFVMTSVLHHMRTGDHRKHVIRKFEFARQLISPRCFDRFNDGIIQAAILRASEVGELDYSVSTTESASMSQVLEFIFSNQKNESGEAATEFLMALSLDRMKLTDSDFNKVRRKYRNRGSKLNQFLWKAIKR